MQIVAGVFLLSMLVVGISNPLALLIFIVILSAGGIKKV